MSRALSFFVVVSCFLATSAVASDRWYGTVTYRYHQVEDTDQTRETEGTTSTTGEHFTVDLTAVAHLDGGKEGTVLVRGQSRTTKSSKNVTPDSCHATAPGLETVSESSSISTASGSARSTIPNPWVDIHIKKDGSYVIPLSIGMEIPNASLKIQTHTASRSECPGSLTRAYNSSVDLKVGLAGHTLFPEGKTDKPDGNRLDGSFSKTEQTARGRYTISATWNLTRDRSARVQAEPGGPYAVVRGSRVRLDGSRSKGKIEKYAWIILPAEGCPAELEATSLQGSRQEFPVLCSLRGFLVVSGDGESDREPFFVDVTPRKWKTDFSRGGEETFDERIIKGHLFFGKNRCAVEGAEPNHFIHPGALNNSWEKEGYTLSQVGEGPFAGFWYVASENLRISRRPFINQRLLPPDGEIYKLNAPTNLADMNLVIRQVRVHEKLHSDLAEERLKDGSPDFDPALRIERLFGKDRDALVFDADFAVRDAESEIGKASAEQKVKDKMKGKGMREFNRRGKLIVPDPGTGGTTILEIRSFADLGD